MRRGVQDPRVGTIVRPHTSTIGRPVPATTHVVEPLGSFDDAEVGRRIEVAGDVVAHEAGDREVGQVVAAIDPRRSARSAPCHFEDVPGLRRRVDVVTVIGNPRVMRVRRIDVNRADGAARRIEPGRIGIDAVPDHGSRRDRWHCR